jgi:lambda family phage portal protein
VNWLDRFVISAVSPQWALRRTQARRALALYEAAEPSRLRKERKDKRSANAQNRGAAMTLRTQARHLEQNLDIASGALDVIVNNVVGSGIMPEPQVLLANGEPASEVNRALLKIFDDWIFSPEVTRQHDYYSLQRLAARSWIRDGEIFGQRLIGNIAALDHNTILPYSLEMIEADFVPLDMNDAARGIQQGVELNVWGAPRAYHLYKTHPGEEQGAFSLETKRVSADRIFHVKLVKRLHQIRGVTQFASVINRLDDIKEIDESERVAARVAAAMSAYIKKGTPDLYSDEDHPLNADGTRDLRSMEMVPGMIFDDLAPGEDIGTIASNRPNNALIPFRDAQLRSAAAGMGASYSSMSKNYNGTYSAQRQELVEQYSHYRALTGQLVFRLCQPVWDGFIDAVRLSGAVNLQGIDPATVYDVSHAAPPMPWIDPLKEVEANAMLEDRGYKSRSRIIRERGDNPDQVNQELVRDAAEAERLGLEFGKDKEAAAAADAADLAAKKADEQAQTAGDDVKQLVATMQTGFSTLVSAIAAQPEPVVNVTIEPAVVNVPVTVGAPVVQNHLPETQVTVEAHMPAVEASAVHLEATIEAPTVHVAAPQVDVHMPTRGSQIIEAKKLPDGSLRAEVRESPKH